MNPILLALGNHLAMRALTPALPGCVIAGQRMTIDRPQMRATLTEAVYHILNNAHTAGRLEAPRSE